MGACSRAGKLSLVSSNGITATASSGEAPAKASLSTVAGPLTGVAGSPGMCVLPHGRPAQAELDQSGVSRPRWGWQRLRRSSVVRRCGK